MAKEDLRFARLGLADITTEEDPIMFPRTNKLILRTLIKAGLQTFAHQRWSLIISAEKLSDVLLVSVCSMQ